MEKKEIKKNRSYKTKTSGDKDKFKSGMQRDSQDDKPRFDLIIPKDIPYEETMIFRWAALLKRGMNNYGERNWEKANTQEEYERFKASAWRHFIQLMSGDDSEDHSSAVFFNLNAMEYVKWKMEN
jgi:hypothetical protein